MKTNLRLRLLVFVALVLSLATVQAAVEISETAVSINADYGDFSTEDQKFINKTTQITVRNTETSAVSVQTEVAGLPSSYNVPAISLVNIPSGETRVITFAVRVPHMQDSGEKEIGTIIIKDSNSNVQYDSVILKQDTESMLEVDELKVDYDYGDGSAQRDTFPGSTNNWELDRGIRPGSEVILTFQEIKNLFDRDYDDSNSEIDNIVITIDSSDSDLFKENFEEEYDLGSLEAEDKENLEIRFIVSEEADEDEYTLEIEIEGEDGEGAKHSIQKELVLTIERNRDDVRVSKFEIIPESPQACGQVQFEIEIKNFGTRKQDRAALQLFSDSLGIIESIPRITLEKYSNSDNSLRKTFTYDLAKKNIEPGRYAIDLTTFVNLDERSDLQRKQLDIVECSNEEVQVQEEQLPLAAEPDGVEAEENTPAEKISTGKIVQTVEDPYTSEDVLVSLIIISIILILAVIAIFITIIIRTISEVPKK